MLSAILLPSSEVVFPVSEIFSTVRIAAWLSAAMVIVTSPSSFSAPSSGSSASKSESSAPCYPPNKPLNDSAILTRLGRNTTHTKHVEHPVTILHPVRCSGFHSFDLCGI